MTVLTLTPAASTILTLTGIGTAAGTYPSSFTYPGFSVYPGFGTGITLVLTPVSSTALTAMAA